MGTRSENGYNRTDTAFQLAPKRHGLLQELHADSPHGPWAFVLSLTDWENRGFTGGETTIFKPYMLNFWPSFNPDHGFEHRDMARRYKPTHPHCLHCPRSFLQHRFAPLCCRDSHFPG